MTRQLLHIGPPHTGIGGMNTTLRRQQLSQAQFVKLRNLRLLGEAWTRRKGMTRIASGALPAVSLSADAAVPTNLVTIPYTDTGAIVDYNLGTRFTLFASYRLDALAGEQPVIAHSAIDPPWTLTHKGDGKIEATITDAASTTITLTSDADYTKTGRKYDVQAVRDGATGYLYVNGTLAKTAGGLAAGQPTLISTNDIYLASYVGHATGSALTYYEIRLFREAYTDEEWRITQYPWTGAFGDPNLILHLTFEDGSGTSITDHSRVNNQSIAISGNWTWNSSTQRQTIAPVTGIHVFENARGRSWLVADIGENHYRFVLR